MTEELAEEWIKDHSGLVGSYKYVKYDYDSMQQAFLAGLKARTRWHDLRKDPNDLPKDNKNVSDQDGNNVRYVERLNRWFYRHDNCEAKVIAWSELPIFKE